MLQKSRSRSGNRPNKPGEDPPTPIRQSVFIARPLVGVTFADLAHLVERNLAKVEVAGSSPVIRSILQGIHAEMRGYSYGVVAKR